MSVPIISDIQRVLNQIASGVQSISATIGSWVDQFIKGLAGFFKPIAEAIFGAFIGLGNFIYNGLTFIANGIKDALIGAFSKLASAFESAFATLGSWFYNAFSYIASGLSRLGEWFSNGLKWIGDGFVKLGTDIANAFRGLWDTIVSGAKWIAGQLWSALVTLGQYIMQGIQWIVQQIFNALGWLAGTLFNWMRETATGLGRWLGGLLSGLAQRIYRMIQVDVAIVGIWKSAERLIHAQSFKDMLFGFTGMIIAPIVGTLVSNLIASIFTPQAIQQIPIIPTPEVLSFTAPSIPAPPSPTPVYSEPVERAYKEFTIVNQPFVIAEVLTDYPLRGLLPRTVSIQSKATAELMERDAYAPPERVVIEAYPVLQLEPYASSLLEFKVKSIPVLIVAQTGASKLEFKPSITPAVELYTILIQQQLTDPVSVSPSTYLASGIPLELFNNVDVKYEVLPSAQAEMTIVDQTTASPGITIGRFISKDLTNSASITPSVIPPASASASLSDPVSASPSVNIGRFIQVSLTNNVSITPGAYPQEIPVSQSLTDPVSATPGVNVESAPAPPPSPILV